MMGWWVHLPPVAYVPSEKGWTPSIPCRAAMTIGAARHGYPPRVVASSRPAGSFDYVLCPRHGAITSLTKRNALVSKHVCKVIV